MIFISNLGFGRGPNWVSDATHIHPRHPSDTTDRCLRERESVLGRIPVDLFRLSSMEGRLQYVRRALLGCVTALSIGSLTLPPFHFP